MHKKVRYSLEYRISRNTSGTAHGCGDCKANVYSSNSTVQGHFVYSLHPEKKCNFKISTKTNAIDKL